MCRKLAYGGYDCFRLWITLLGGAFYLLKQRFKQIVSCMAKVSAIQQYVTSTLLMSKQAKYLQECAFADASRTVKIPNVFTMKILVIQKM